ncbi:MAG TPA: glycoside hydrolase family 172 protein [Bacteroidales bacterium]|nr:glycoside hydrolase family 172 protein [Bacteroidales bacterium]
MKHLSTPAVLLITGTLLIATGSCRNEKIITFRALLKEMASPEAITRFPDPSYKLVQQSSYDRKSIHPDSSGWFANDDYTQFIREEENDGRREYVMFEADGPGAVVRWWMTFGNADALESTIRVYIDGEEAPVLEGRAPDLVGGGLLAPEPLSTSVSATTELQARGYNLYLPLPFAKSCKITLENEAVIITPERRTPSIYYNIGTRLYNKGTRLISLTKEMLLSDTLAIRECASVLLPEKTTVNKNEYIRFSSGKYAPGTSTSFRLNEGGKAVSSFSLRLEAGDTAAALRKTMIRMSFDGRQTVNVPAGNFFGTGYSINTYRTYYSNVDSTGLMTVSRLMPFRDSCTIEILNGTVDSIAIFAEVRSLPYAWDNSSMHFGASWNEYRDIETAGATGSGGTGNHFDISFVSLQGKGVYAGDGVVVINTVDAWWGEGDEKIFVDGEVFPSSIGTGTEDYFGYAWCRPEPFSHPFISQPVGDGNYHPGMSVNMRYRNLDAIPFNESIKSNIELWHWLKTKIDYSLVSYYYKLPDLIN